jgi:hypothetical protein
VDTNSFRTRGSQGHGVIATSWSSEVCLALAEAQCDAQKKQRKNLHIGEVDGQELLRGEAKRKSTNSHSLAQG